MHTECRRLLASYNYLQSWVEGKKPILEVPKINEGQGNSVEGIMPCEHNCKLYTKCVDTGYCKCVKNIVCPE